MVKKNIKKTIEKHNLINAGEHIVIGLSGGPDSVCLFSVLNELSGEVGFTLHAVHVNHGFRPGAAEEDQRYVEQLCGEKGVECTTFVYDCNAVAKEQGLSDEEAGRKVRYKSFRDVADRLVKQGVAADKIKIAVAQNADDQAETVLFRLLRGTGTDGLAGMAYSRREDSVQVIRPLLDTWRKDIEIYCEEHDLMPRIDHTNMQPIYTRNKIRLELIPYIQQKFNPNIMEALNRLSVIAGEDKAYLWQCAEDAYAELEISPGVLNQQGLAELAAPIRHRVMMKALQEQGLEQDVTYIHLNAADKILEADGESRTVEFPGGYRMSVRYGEVTFYNVQRLSQDNIVTCDNATPLSQGALNSNDNGELGTCDKNAAFSASVCQIDEFRVKCHMTDPECVVTRQTAQFDADKIAAFHGAADVQLRIRREGDFLSIKGGRKKLQDLFVDMKVPKEYRDCVLVAAVGSEILWLPVQEKRGVKKARYSYRCKLDIDTKKCLVLEIDCEI